MIRSDLIRSVAVTIAAWCYVLASTALYPALAESWQIGGQRHAAEIAPSEIIWQRAWR